MQTIYHNISNLHHLKKEVSCPQTCFEFVARRNHQGRQIAALLQPSPGHLEFGLRSWSHRSSGRQIIVLTYCTHGSTRQWIMFNLVTLGQNNMAMEFSHFVKGTLLQMACLMVHLPLLYAVAAMLVRKILQSHNPTISMLRFCKCQRALKFCRVFPYHNNITTTIISYPWASGTDCFKFCHAVAIRTTQWILRQWRYSRYSWYKYSWYSFMVSWNPTSIISAHNEKNQTLFKLQ